MILMILQFEPCHSQHCYVETDKVLTALITLSNQQFDAGLVKTENMVVTIICISHNFINYIVENRHTHHWYTLSRVYKKKKKHLQEISPTI